MIATRRALLSAVAVLPFAGCASFGSGLAAVQSDAALILNGINAILPAIQSFPGVPSTLGAVVGAYIARAQAALAALRIATTAAGATPSVQSIEAAVNGIVLALGQFGVALPAPFGTYLIAAETLVPIILAAVGVSAPAAAMAGAMTPDQARAVLAKA